MGNDFEAAHFGVFAPPGSLLAHLNCGITFERKEKNRYVRLAVVYSIFRCLRRAYALGAAGFGHTHVNVR
jgi:hypothetical protein